MISINAFEVSNKSKTISITVWAMSSSDAVCEAIDYLKTHGEKVGGSTFTTKQISGHPCNYMQVFSQNYDDTQSLVWESKNGN